MKKDKTDKLANDYVIKSVNDFFNIDQDISIQMLHRIVFRNILYYMGEQWMKWLPNAQKFVSIVTRKNPEPTPVSNIIRDYVRSMKSLILNKDFSVSIWPNSEDSEDAEAAKLGELLLEDMENANDEEFLDEKEKVAMWVVMAGNGFMRVFPELDRGEWFLDAKGDLTRTGEVVAENIPMFNVFVDLMGDRLNKKRAIGIQSAKPREWVEDTFKVSLSTDEKEQATNYQKRLMKIMANVSPWKGNGLETLSDLENDDMVIFKEIEYKPDAQYQNGRFVATCCGQVCFAHDRMPIPVDEEGKWEYSITDFHYYHVPGRFWSDAGINDLISPQNTINQIDQALEINRKSLGRNMVLTGAEPEFKRMTKYGEQLLVLKYDAMLMGGMKPEFRQGLQLPNQILDERNIHRQVAQEAAGDPKNVMRGQAPSAQASGVMVDTLREAASQGHEPDVKRFYRSLKRVKRKQLILAKNVYTEERMIKISGKGKQILIRSFTGADLRDNTDVRLELSSGISSTKTGQVQMFLKLIEAGLFSAQSDLEPEFREELMRRMGLSGFADHKNTDVLRAQGENSMISHAAESGAYRETEVETPNGILEIPYIPGIFYQMNNPKSTREQPLEPIVLSEDPKFKYDNHFIHYNTHREEILSEGFKDMDPDAQDILIAHTDIHHTLMQQKIAEEMQRQEAMEGKNKAA